jgi:hypothetical protein
VIDIKSVGCVSHQAATTAAAGSSRQQQANLQQVTQLQGCDEPQQQERNSMKLFDSSVCCLD